MSYIKNILKLRTVNKKRLGIISKPLALF
jgi:hypothetical protein